MKINAASIFGICLMAAGVLLLIYSGLHESASGPGMGQSSEASQPHNTIYVVTGIAGIASGAVITLLGQFLKRSPKPTDPL